MTKLRMLMLTLAALTGLAFAAMPSLADHGHVYRGGHGYYGHGYYGQGYHHHHAYRPVPVTRGCMPYWQGYRPVVVSPAPGFFYSGRNLSFGIGF